MPLWEITNSPCVTRHFVAFASTSKSLEHAVPVKGPLKSYYTFLVLHSGVSYVFLLDNNHSVRYIFLSDAGA